MSLYDRQHKINRQLSVSSLTQQSGGYGWSNCKRWTREFPTPHRFSVVPHFGDEAVNVVFTRNTKFKAVYKQTPGPGHYTSDISDATHTGPAISFSNVTRDKDVIHTSIVDREWKEKLGPGCYNIEIAKPVIGVKICRVDRNFDLNANGPNLGPEMGPGKYPAQTNWWVPSFVMPDNQAMSFKTPGNDTILLANMSPTALAASSPVVKKERAQQFLSMHHQAIERAVKVKAEKMNHKRDLVGKWERIREEHKQQEILMAEIKAKQQETERKWFEALVLGRRSLLLGNLLVAERLAKAALKIKVNAAMKIQKCAKRYIEWQRMKEAAGKQKLYRVLDSILFHKLISNRAKRRKKSAEVIFK